MQDLPPQNPEKAAGESYKPPAKPKKKSGGWKFQRFQQMTPEQQAIVGNMLLTQSPNKVAKFIQQEWKLFNDIEPLSLQRVLYDYREHTLGPQIVAKYEKAIGADHANVQKAVFKMRKDRDTLEELFELVDIQKKRIKKLLDKEEKEDKLIIPLKFELELAFKMLSRCADIQMDLGITHRAPKNVSGIIKTPSGQSLDFVMQESYDPELNQILQDAQRIIQGSYEEAVPAGDADKGSRSLALPEE